MTRRSALKLGACGLAASLCRLRATEPDSAGIVMGETKGAEVGMRVLKEGGNAIDAIVAAALAGAVHAPNQFGIGGYGGHMVIRLANGKVTCIDFNTTAPAGGSVTMYGWLASSVPGILAGLQLALDRFGTRSFKSVVEPAIELAETGFPMSQGLANAIRSRAVELQADPASARLYFPKDNTLRNLDLARMLRRLARQNSVRDFYEGDIARQIARAFENNGGLVTRKDLARYKALEVAPVQMDWKDYTFYTPPVTAGGITVLQAFGILKELSPELWTDRTLVETMRLAWKDRLAKLGDNSPSHQLITPDYCRRCAESVKAGVQAAAISRPHRGTVHLNAADSAGNVVALTLTHGNAFGACVTVDGLGLTLGHGMSRFEPDPHHPNAPGPGKRPLTNMCPTLVLRKGKPVLALGAAGGRLIVNTVFHVLWNFAAGKSLPEAIRAPRWHTEGNKELRLEKQWPDASREQFAALGYEIKPGGAAVARAIGIGESGNWEAAAR